MVVSGLAASAQSPSSYTAQLVKSVVEQEAVTAEDLEVSSPTILPGNPLYFLKNISRGVQSFFTFNSVKKAELELRFADERLVEAKTLVEKSPENTAALQNAIESYQERVAALETRLEGLSETSQNPNVNALLEKVTDRAIKHEKLFDEIISKTAEGAPEAQAIVASAQGKIFDAVFVIPRKFEDAETFAGRIEKAVEQQEGSFIAPLRAVEILNRLESLPPREEELPLEEGEQAPVLAPVAPTEQQLLVEENLSAVKERLLEKAATAIVDVAHQSETSPQAVSEILKALPGDTAVREKTLKQLENKIQEPQNVDVPSVIGTIVTDFAESVLIRVYSPRPQDLVSSPLSIYGTVKQKWGIFEGEAGTVTLYDGNGKNLGVGILRVDGDWMRDPELKFETEINFTKPSTSSGMLVFIGNSPKEGSFAGSYKLPVVFSSAPAADGYRGVLRADSQGVSITMWGTHNLDTEKVSYRVKANNGDVLAALRKYEGQRVIIYGKAEYLDLEGGFWGIYAEKVESQGETEPHPTPVIPPIPISTSTPPPELIP